MAKQTFKHLDNITTLLEHTNATPIGNHSEMGYGCYFCEDFYEVPKDLKKHTRNIHSADFGNIMDGKLSDHVVNLDITGLKCNICDLKILYTTPSLEDMIRHLKDHDKDVHMDIKNQIMPFSFKHDQLVCVITYCQQEFEEFEKLVEHMHFHYRNYVCEECAAGFVNESSYRAHLVSHSKKNYKREPSEEEFDDVDKKRVKGTEVRLYSRSPKQCDYCEKQFKLQRNREQHMASVHGKGFRKIKCQICNQTCSTLEVLRKHTRKYHMKQKIRETPNPENASTNNDKKIERSKHMDNITTLFHHTNATPIRSQKDIGYGCCFCKNFYRKPADLKEHTRGTHQSEIPNVMRDKSLNDYHVKLDISNLQCNECETKMDNLDDMMRHLKEHKMKIHLDINNHIMPFNFDEDELRCVICKAEFNKFKKLAEHMNKHYRNRVCDVCGAGFINERSFQIHFQVHKKGVFACKFCEKVFDTMGKKKSHESSVHIHSQMLSKCGYCNKKFKTHRNKEKHISSEHGVRLKEIKCKLCEKVYLTANALRVHTRRDHLKERPFECHLCDYTSYGSRCLKNHMLKHTGVREFQCDVCLKSYARKKTLREHMRIHEDDRRFKCEHCGLAFIQNCSLKGHLRSKHRDLVSAV